MIASPAPSSGNKQSFIMHLRDQPMTMMLPEIKGLSPTFKAAQYSTAYSFQYDDKSILHYASRIVVPTDSLPLNEAVRQMSRDRWGRLSSCACLLVVSAVTLLLT
jgi:hypothetical protein